MLQIPIIRKIGELSIGLEPYLWSALDEIAVREETSVETLCSELLARLVVRQQRHQDVHDPAVALVSAMRVLPVAYFRYASMSPDR